MSTLPGLASKGEKSKSKFQSLDINNLYRVSRGENLEKQQQKSTLTYKHGMQSLGKVPNARRAPANLPSLKSEHSGSETSVPLVPPGGPGWGKQEVTTSTTSSSPTTTTTTSTSVNNTGTQLSSHQAAIALPVTTTIPPTTKHLTSATPATTTDKSWSAVMSGVDTSHHPPLYQSPQFQHEFPSLSVGDGGPIRSGGSDAHYAPGLSLRPQTEGSWIQGGSRPGSDAPHRVNSVPSGAQPQPLAPAGQSPQQPLPPQYRAVMPTFMYKGNMAQSGNGVLNQNVSPLVGRNRHENNRQPPPPPRLVDVEEITPRPIIKEEELSRMDDIDRDMGWTAHDEIDYNQKLTFSDEELTDKPKKDKKDDKQKELEKENQLNDGQPKNWSPNMIIRQRSSDEEMWKQRRSQHTKDLEITVQRAKLRKEEEEKRFNEATKQGAAKKLMELEQKMNKRSRGEEENAGTINPAIVPQKPIVPADIPLPDFQKDKERDRESRSRTPNDNNDKISSSTNRESSFRQMTQIEGKNFTRKYSNKNTDVRERDREVREQNGPNFSKHFQTNLPPRFLRQHRNTPSNISSQQMHYQYDNRWSNQNSTKCKSDSSEHDLDINNEKREYKRQGSDDSHRSLSYKPDRYGNDLNHDYRQDYDYSRRNDEKWMKDKDRIEKKQDYGSLEEWQNNNDYKRDKRDDKLQDKHERPQRPDSRDSRTSRDSLHSRDSARDSETREHIGSWSESIFEPAYEEKRRDKDDRRVVPGPITKDRIEADDLKNEKRNLTQLKRGQIQFPEKKSNDSKKDDKSLDSEKKDSNENIISKVWADLAPNNDNDKTSDKNKLSIDVKLDLKSNEIDSRKSDKSDNEYKDKDDKRGNRNRSYPINKGWGSSNEYHRSGWSKRTSTRNVRSNGGPKSLSSIDFHGTDSEGSNDDNNKDFHSKNLKTIRKIDKDDKNKEIKNEKSIKIDKQIDKHDNYIPRGEPSKHGRGGGNFRGRGGLIKRIDGYGPPPSKSPFSHHDDKDKKINGENDIILSDDKIKQNQQALSTGIIGSAHKELMHNQYHSDKKLIDDKNKIRKTDIRRGKSKTKGDKKDDGIDTNSDNSDDKSGRRIQKSNVSSRNTVSQLKRNNPPRLIGDKRNFNSPRNENSISRQNSSNALRSQNKKDDKLNNSLNTLCNAIADITLKNKDNNDQIEDSDEKLSLLGDSDGFQEVKSKKTVKERSKSDEKILSKSPFNKNDKERKGTTKNNQLTQQQISNIPSLMATPIQPPPVLPISAKTYDRSRNNKLPPRLVKQRLQKVQMQNVCDVNDINKVNPNINVYNIKDSSINISNAWDKSLGTQLRNLDSDVLGVTSDSCKNIESNSQTNSPNNEKLMGKTNQLQQDKAILDGTTPPVTTIIFENTNFKSVPGTRNTRNDKPRSKLEDSGLDSNVVSGYNKPIGDILITKDKQTESSIQIPLPFKEDNTDIKLDFFESELSHLTDDKSSKNLCMPRSMHVITNSSSNSNTLSTADALNFKIQSVKKMWETPSDHNVGQEDNSFKSSFVSDPSTTLDSNTFKGTDNADDGHEGYNPPNQGGSNSSTNVCKVKPTQQITGGGGQTVLSSSTSHQPHTGIVAPTLMGNHPLSPPPPLQQCISGNVNIGQPPQQYTSNQHISYQAGLGGSNQYGISTIPSPPTVVYNSTQQLQAQTASLYGAFPIDQLSGQGRSQYPQYPNHYNLSQTGSSPYSTQSLYLPTAQAHPPPTAQAPPDIYQNISNYRLSTQFGQNQQLNNPTTVLISSTSNSLMSASVKPSSQPISAIGTKAGGVGQAYQPQSQQSQQVFMTYEPALQGNYLPSAGVIQRAPTGPVQNNVVPTLQPSSSYYSGSTGGQTGYFQQPGNSTIQSAQLQQHQTAGYGLQGNVFGTHNQSNAGLQGYNFLSSPMLAAALNVQQQQFRSAAAAGLTTQYMKNVGNQSMNDQSTRSQQLKSPGSQEVLSSVFNSGSQISSPKLRQNCKQPPPQPSPTAQHKYNLYTNNQSGNIQRYPAPIQRPVNYQQNLGSVQQNVVNNQKHRGNTNNSNKSTSRQYYQSNSLTTQNDKCDDPKLNDGPLSSTNSTNVNSSVSTKTVIGPSSTSSVVSSTDIKKDAINIEESSSLKD